MEDELILRIKNSNMDEQLKKDILARFEWIWTWNKRQLTTFQQEMPKEFEEVFRKHFEDLLA